MAQAGTASASRRRSSSTASYAALRCHPIDPKVILCRRRCRPLHQPGRRRTLSLVDSPMNGQAVWSIAIDPVDPSYIYAGTGAPSRAAMFPLDRWRHELGAAVARDPGVLPGRQPSAHPHDLRRSVGHRASLVRRRGRRPVAQRRPWRHVAAPRSSAASPTPTSIASRCLPRRPAAAAPDVVADQSTRCSPAPTAARPGAAPRRRTASRACTTPAPSSRWPATVR